MAYKHNLFLSALEVGKFRMEVLADSVSISKNAFLSSSMVPSNFFHRTEESRAVLSRSRSLSYHPPHWPLPWLLVSKFQPPPHGKRVWLGRKASIMAGESKENAQAPGFLFPPLLFHPDSHHGLVCPHSGVPSPLAHPFRKTKWFSFY